MRTTLKHGAVLEAATPAEVAALLDARRTDSRSDARRIRANAMIVLDGTGSGQDEVFAVPVGFQFDVRRVVIDLDTATDPSTGNVALNAAGKTVEYLRSGQRIEYAVPTSPNAIPQVPGAQTWGDQQGPYLRNGEVFEVRAKGLTPGARLGVTVEGILTRPGEPK